jgi:hypothetical protein
MKRRLALVGLALVGVLVFAPALGLSAWTAPESLMPSGVTSSSPVQVAYDGDGNAIAAYTRYLGTTDELYLRERPPGGPWGPPQLVPLDPPLGSYIRDLQLGVNDAGDVVIAFRSGGIHALRRPAGGTWSTVTSWGSPGSSGPGSGCPNRPALDVGEDGTAVVAWAPSSSCSGLVTYWRVLAAGFTPGSGWETTPQVWDLSATDVNTWPDVVVDDDGRATVAFGAQTSSPLGTYEEWTVDRSPSGTWESPALLSANGGEPALDSRGAVTVIAWGAPGGIVAAIRDSSGWGPVQTMPFPGPADNQWSVAVDGTGTAYVANSPLDGSVRRVYVASHPAGGNWTSTPISPAGENARSPLIAANDAGDVALVWGGVVAGQWLGMAALRPAGGSWPAAGQLVTTVPAADDRIGGAVAVDRFGHALAVSTPFTGFNVPGGAIIETRDPAAANAGSPPTVSPSSAEVGDTVTCSPGTFAGTPPFRYSYAWLRDGAPIASAASSSYETTEDDAGTAIGCRVTATNEAGSASADSTTVDVGSGGPGPDPCADAPDRSGGLGGPFVTLTVVNEGPAPVEVYWLSFAGIRVLYDTLQPGQSVNHLTYASDVWLVVDADTGECLGWASGSDGEFRIGGSGEPPPADTDRDGLYDMWETNGIDVDDDGTIDLPLHQAPYNADPNHKDLFLEVDYMAPNAPQAGTLGDVATAFANAPVSNPDGTSGVRLHAMLGDQVPTYDTVCFWDCAGFPAPISFNELKGGQPDVDCDGFFGTAAERGGANCDAALDARRLVFRYAVFGANYSERPGSSGVGEIWGNDLMVTLGSAYASWIAATGNLRGAEAGTLLHELGHTLGLDHGGGDALNCKPNYQSVMNYTRQVPNVDPARPLDYSQEQLPTLNESSLNEFAGIGATDGTVIYGVTGVVRVVSAESSVDWNGNSSLQSSVAADITRIGTVGGCGANPGQVLPGHDDWATLRYSFRGSPNAAEGATDPPRQPPVVELTAASALETAKAADNDGDGISNASESICAVTRGYMEASAKYRNAKPAQRNGPNALVADACKAIARITPATKPGQKRGFVAAYKDTVDDLRDGGWLTTVEATALKTLADTL